jgi:hypothetical protein
MSTSPVRAAVSNRPEGRHVALTAALILGAILATGAFAIYAMSELDRVLVAFGFDGFGA